MTLTSRSGLVFLAVAASAAIALPSLIAWNVPPSATFFNQAAAYVGWGGFLILVAAAMGPRDWPRRPEAWALLGSLLVVAVAAIGASLLAGAPWSLSLSATLTILAAVLAVAIGASATRAGIDAPVFRAFCIALVVAGLASSAIGLVQVFAPSWPDGNWIAGTAIPGRATGNLRQPNHLSSLLLWSIVAAFWLAEVRVLPRAVAGAVVALFVWVIVLSASRTGALAMITLALWGVLDRRLSRPARIGLLLAPLLYLLIWWGMTVWASQSHHLFGGQTRFGGSGDISGSRFAIWRDTLSLIRMHPWSGVGFGEFNFAWSLTPFPNRSGWFFDHTHNLALNFLVELGIPLGTLLLVAMGFALWGAWRNAVAAGRVDDDATAPYPVQRPAFVIVLLVATHSMLEYPLWYAYFLLPAAFAFGLCLERRDAGEAERAAQPRGNATRPYVLAAMLLVLGGALALWDYSRVSVIFSPGANAGPLEQRIAAGRHSVLFGHHADYAAATVAEHPGEVPQAFRRAPHFLLDTRLMLAWAKALDENGEFDKARYMAARLKEFRNESSTDWFVPCDPFNAAAAASAAAASGLPVPTTPFQCRPPKKAWRYEDFD